MLSNFTRKTNAKAIGFELLFSENSVILASVAVSNEGIIIISWLITIHPNKSPFAIEGFPFDFGVKLTVLKV